MRALGRRGHSRVLHASDSDAKTEAERKAIVEVPNERGALAADATFVVRAKADDASSSWRAAQADDPGDQRRDGSPEMAPWAMTGAIWIDADGDGKSLGR